MNHPSQFAQPFSWGIAAKAADAGPLLPASAATSFDHDQILPHGLGWGSPAKLGMLGSHAAIPARVNLFRGQGFLPRTCRSLHGFRPFSAATRLGCNRALASINDAADHFLNHRSYRFPSHSKTSVRSPHHHEAKGVGSDQKAIGVSQNVVDC
jgi:hypothetical protein